jgi:hypothetical protein
MRWGAISSLAFVAIFLISLINAFLRNDAEPQLVLAYFGFPTSWLFFTIFNPLLEWLGPIGSIGRRIAEWALLGGAGILQYWLIGAVAAFLINQNQARQR